MKIFKAILISIGYTAIYYILQVIVQVVMLFSWGYSFTMENLTLTIIISSVLGFFIYWGIVKLRKQKLSSACSGTRGGTRGMGQGGQVPRPRTKSFPSYIELYH